MSDTQTRGGFAGDPAEALTGKGADGCCGTAAQQAEQAGPCCGTAAAAEQAGSCCGTEAKAEAVAAGQGCCG